MWQVIKDVILLLLAVWFFATTFEPLRSRAYNRLFTPRTLLIFRVLLAIGALSALAVLCSDIIR